MPAVLLAGACIGVAGAGGACCRCAGLRKTRRDAYAGVVRLVSLLPSATEIIYALGLGGQLVGVTFECDEPASARADKTVVVGGLGTRGMSPGQIDAYVRGRLAEGGDLYTLHEQALADLRPDLIVTQDLCRVCALPSGHVQAALGYLGCQAQVLTLDPRSLDQVLDSILAVGRAAGVPGPQARRVCPARRSPRCLLS